MHNPFLSLEERLETYPIAFIQEIQAWQETNHARFANAKIFREEFYAHINGALQGKYNFDMNRIRERTNQDFKNELEKIAQQNKDNYYAIQDLSRAVARLTEELQAQKPAKVLKSKKKK